LLQVIAEQEHLAEPILTQEFMVNVIRAYGTGVQGLISGHLEQNLKQILNQQQVRERVKPMGASEAPRIPLSAARSRDGDKDRDEHLDPK
ncbi:MAG: hypothetical protein M3N50_14270, partial [Pseudomonadota bacterium]|nr:hypothetical protein [Pseudomonadota bacterium]